MMKKSRIFKIIVGLTLLALGAWLRLVLFAPETTKYDSLAPAPSTPSASPTQKQGAPLLKPSTGQNLAIYKSDPKWIWWNQQMESDPKFEWKMPIKFYGKVIDQDDQPIEGVKVVMQWTDMSAKGSSERTVSTDAAGRFELTGVMGKRLGINQVSKEGYYRANQGIQTSFEYAAFFENNYHRPDPDKPVVFRMRKAGEICTELIVRESLIGLPASGVPQTIDLRAGSKSAVGNVAIRVTRGETKDGNRYDWSIEIKGSNGAGLIESEDEFMFEAPEVGYFPKYSYQFDADAPDWQSEARKNYFVRSSDGQEYARLEIKFMPKYQQNGAARIRFFVNPTGSRNLEYTPNKVLPR